jgi:hypothetical protein
VHDPLTRSYLLLVDLGITPNVAAECSAVELDELLYLHCRVQSERGPNG